MSGFRVFGFIRVLFLGFWVASIALFRKMGGDGASESGLECCGFRASELWHSELRFRLQAHGLLPGPETRLLDKASSGLTTLPRRILA